MAFDEPVKRPGGWIPVWRGIHAPVLSNSDNSRQESSSAFISQAIIDFFSDWTPAVASDYTGLANHPVAGDEIGHWVLSHRRTNSSGCIRVTNRGRQPPIAGQFTAWNLEQSTPDTHLKRGASNIGLKLQSGLPAGNRIENCPGKPCDGGIVSLKASFWPVFLKRFPFLHFVFSIDKRQMTYPSRAIGQQGASEPRVGESSL